MEASVRFFRHAYFSFRALFGWLDPKVYLMVMVISPLTQLLFFSLLDKYVYHGHDLGGYVASNALLLCVMNSVFGMLSVVSSDRRMGTLQLVIVSPAHNLAIFLARSTFQILDGFLTSVFGLLIGILLFHIPLTWSMAGGLAIVWFTSIFSACGIGFVFSCFGLWSPSMHLWSNILANLLLLASGANYGTGVLPVWLRDLGLLLPLTRGISVTKQIMNTGSLAHLWRLMGQEFLLGTIYFTLGIILITYAERGARRRGTLDLE